MNEWGNDNVIIDQTTIVIIFIQIILVNVVSSSPRALEIFSFYFFHTAGRLDFPPAPIFVLGFMFLLVFSIFALPQPEVWHKAEEDEEMCKRWRHLNDW